MKTRKILALLLSFFMMMTGGINIYAEEKNGEDEVMILPDGELWEELELSEEELEKIPVLPRRSEEKISEESPASVNGIGYTSNGYMGSYSDYYLNQLPPAEQQLFWDIYHAALNVGLNGRDLDTVSKTYSDGRVAVYGIMGKISYDNNIIHDDQAKRIQRAVFLSFPRLFWLSNTQTNLPGYIVLYSHERFSSGYTRSYYYNIMNTEIEKAEDYASAGANPLEKTRRAEEYLGYNVAYNHENIHEISQSAAGAFAEKSCVCMGYAHALNIILNDIGIETVTCANANHAWNMVNIGGVWYGADSTNVVSNQSLYRGKYLIMSSSEMAANTSRIYKDHDTFNKYFTFPYAPRKYVSLDYNCDDALSEKDLDALAGYVMKTDTRSAADYDFNIEGYPDIKTIIRAKKELL